MVPPRLAADAGRVSDGITRLIEDLPHSRVRDAMAHAAGGGKRVRGHLVLEGARLFDLDGEAALRPACAIEMMHAYSLVHDDLPAMDDDDLRRGQPTVHRHWDEATAILAGDALQALAFEAVCDPACGAGEVRADLARGLARASGARGMVLGQARDIAAEAAATPLGLDEITAMQEGKTGALIGWAATAGAVMARADPAPLAAYAAALGLAFQIQDDVIDAVGDATAAGKAVGKDAAANKATFVSLLGLDAARARAGGLVDSACDALSDYGARADGLRMLARFVISRQG